MYRNNKSKTKKVKNNKLWYGHHHTCQVWEKIKVTDHVIEQFTKRLQLDNVAKDKIITLIINQVKFSKMISLKGNQEVRNHRGNCFVCKREEGCLVVVTILISQVTMRELYSDDFNKNTVKYEKFMRITETA